MKQILVILWLYAELSGIGTGQAKPSPKPTLIETLLWMNTFSHDHGIVMEGKRVRMQNFFSARGCAAVIETKFLNPSTRDAPVKRTIDVVLGELNSKLTLEANEDGSVDVAFERADAQPKIHQVVEYADGGELEVWAGEDSIFFDTRLSAERFSRAFTYAINLCEAVSRPF